MFFDRKDIAKPCPDTKRMVGNAHLLGIDWGEYECYTGGLEWLRQNISFHVVCPKPNDWSTCSCTTCINPETKMDALANFTKDPSLRWDEGKSYDSTDCLISYIKAVDDEQRTILYNEWQKTEVTRTG